MQISIQLRRDIARGLLGDAPGSSGASALRQVLRKSGIELKPMHPGAGDSELRNHFYVEVDDMEKAATILERLRSADGVLAAYLKPPESPPGS